ncbi:MAG: sugar phosphate isomerase/epimerase family protein [Kiritimatiellia bacterium]|jgi:sugar phosphate isomerase/epimerase
MPNPAHPSKQDAHRDQNKPMPETLDYAVSVSPALFGNPDWAKAFRESGFTKIEASFGTMLPPNEVAIAVQALRPLIRSGDVDVASVHIPFTPFEKIDVASLDEKHRRHAVSQFSEFLRQTAELGPRALTIHSGGEPNAPSEREAKIAAMRRTLEDLAPLTRQMGASINVELLPRTCIGNSEHELLAIVEGFPTQDVNVCLDVNHIMARADELPAITTALLPRLHSLHLSDYDGVDECHWLPGLGVIDWPALMQTLRGAAPGTLAIFEVTALEPAAWQDRRAHPRIHLRNLARARAELDKLLTTT